MYMALRRFSTLFIFFCSTAKMDSQHSCSPLTARPTTDSSFTNRGSWRETPQFNMIWKQNDLNLNGRTHCVVLESTVSNQFSLVLGVVNQWTSFINYCNNNVHVIICMLYWTIKGTHRKVEIYCLVLLFSMTTWFPSLLSCLLINN